MRNEEQWLAPGHDTFQKDLVRARVTGGRGLGRAAAHIDLRRAELGGAGVERAGDRRTVPRVASLTPAVGSNASDDRVVRWVAVLTRGSDLWETPRASRCLASLAST